MWQPPGHLSGVHVPGSTVPIAYAVGQARLRQVAEAPRPPLTPAELAAQEAAEKRRNEELVRHREETQKVADRVKDVLGENKMGVPLDESLNRLYRRMPSAAMQQMVTAILLARETGGNLPMIFTRIVASTRERKKIEKNLQTLTVQGKIQACRHDRLAGIFLFYCIGLKPAFL